MRAEEAPQLLLAGPYPPLGLPLEGTERFEFTLRLDHPFAGGDAERANQLVLQVGDAYVETEALHVVACQVGAEAFPLESPPEVALLSGVTETCEPDVQPFATVLIEEASDVRRTPHRHDRNSLRVEIPAAAPREGLERELVAHPFNQHGRARAEGIRRRLHAAILRPPPRYGPAARTA